ncbi:MAG: Chorismate mutase II [uncultured Thermomicrobiales bacterium]|uniref:chorismate mutase n=1 Tax=uncultured Thermomicrobiales bacterium TaxID=1645740 RepID=A0A6J4VR07_9BACT|nr:MAG: Chorismate mutase II [uncultured Thermomicrobiales bacterium]
MGEVLCRGVRGATTVETNTAEAIVAATGELLRTMIEANAIEQERVASVLFTTTMDLNAAFPAVAARELGWTDIALLNAHEMAVPGALTRCIRILLHLNTDRTAKEIRHIYLREAKKLRPDLAMQAGGWSEALER